MKLKVFTVCLLICCVSLETVNCRLPDFTAATLLQVNLPVISNITTSRMQSSMQRLPGLCRRLKRRRVTVLCNMKKFCWGRGQRHESGQVCRCPRGAKCSHFFVHSL